MQNKKAIIFGIIGGLVFIAAGIYAATYKAPQQQNNQSAADQTQNAQNDDNSSSGIPTNTAEPPQPMQPNPSDTGPAKTTQTMPPAPSGTQPPMTTGPALVPPTRAGQSQVPTNVSTAPTTVNISSAADDSSASPDTFTVHKGDTVNLTLDVKTTGVYYGGLDFRSTLVNPGTILPGKSKTVTFTAPDSSFDIHAFWPSSGVEKATVIHIIVQ